MDYNKRLKKLEEVVAEILIDTHHIASDTKDIKENQQRMIKSFNNFGMLCSKRWMPMYKR